MNHPPIRKISFLSIVIPVYNEEDMLPVLRSELEAWLSSLPDMETEVILVNDGSKDSSLPYCLGWANENKRVKVVSLSRNFGHQIAVSAGLDYSEGEAVVVMDADLQDPLPVIPEMIRRYEEGCDVAYGQRLNRKGESRFKLATAWLFYRLMRGLVHKDLPLDTGDFRLLSRRCVDALKAMPETHRFLRGIVAWMGFKQAAVPYERSERARGTTKYPLGKMASLAWNAATSFSSFPLRVINVFGVLFALFGLGCCVWALSAYFAGETIRGWTSLIGLVSVIGGMLMLAMGVMGEYIGKIYEEVKKRPLYLVDNLVNFTDSALTENNNGYPGP
ncbi:MAG: glycosyltransferase family 2 protein [Desulfarculales bacterium]|jgi:dolichol-phosphate mannosyltransferase|nr:glycosyltransferase family 2 protein [Desulfarculales bacterium]